MKQFILSLLFIFFFSYTQAQCVVKDSLVANPPPIGGCYLPGTTVTFTLYVLGYQQKASNWFDGVTLKYGSGWEKSTFQSISPAISTSGQGNWNYYTTVTSGGTGLKFGPGYFFDLTADADNDPGNDFGDWTPVSDTVWAYTWSIKIDNAAPSGSILLDSTIITGDGTSGNWKSLYCEDTTIHQFVVCGTATHIENTRESNVVGIYASPGDGYITIAVNGEQPGTTKVTVLNTLGQQVLSDSHAITTGQNQWQVPFTPSAHGVYFVNVETRGGVVTKKVMY